MPWAFTHLGLVVHGLDVLGTIARSLSDTFAGIAPAGVAAVIADRLAGTLVTVAAVAWLWAKPERGGSHEPGLAKGTRPDPSIDGRKAILPI